MATKARIAALTLSAVLAAAGTTIYLVHIDHQETKLVRKFILNLTCII